MDFNCAKVAHEQKLKFEDVYDAAAFSLHVALLHQNLNGTFTLLNDSTIVWDTLIIFYNDTNSECKFKATIKRLYNRLHLTLTLISSLFLSKLSPHTNTNNNNNNNKNNIKRNSKNNTNNNININTNNNIDNSQCLWTQIWEIEVADCININVPLINLTQLFKNEPHMRALLTFDHPDIHNIINTSNKEDNNLLPLELPEKQTTIRDFTLRGLCMEKRNPDLDIVLDDINLNW